MARDWGLGWFCGKHTVFDLNCVNNDNLLIRVYSIIHALILLSNIPLSPRGKFSNARSGVQNQNKISEDSLFKTKSDWSRKNTRQTTEESKIGTSHWDNNRCRTERRRRPSYMSNNNSTAENKVGQT